MLRGLIPEQFTGAVLYGLVLTATGASPVSEKRARGPSRCYNTLKIQREKIKWLALHDTIGRWHVPNHSSIKSAAAAIPKKWIPNRPVPRICGGPSDDG